MRHSSKNAALRDALLAADWAELKEAWDAPEGAPELSANYLAWEKDFLARCGVPARSPRQWRRAVLIAAAAVALLAVGAAAVSQSWVMNVRTADAEHPAGPNEDYANGEQELVLELGDKDYEETEASFPLYAPSWLPDGVTEIRNDLYQGHAVGTSVWREYAWQDPAVGGVYQTDPRVTFSYSRYWNCRSLADHFVYREVTVTGCPGWLLYDEFEAGETLDNADLVWYDDQAEMVFEVSYKDYEEDVVEELYRIAESISRTS